MAAGRFPDFFGDDWQESLDSLKSAPGAFGNILVAASRQVRLLDGLAFALVVAGWLWAIGGFVILGNHDVALLALALLPSVLWFAAGMVGGLVFEIGGIGVHSLLYWESYLLILVCTGFGPIILRLALNPRDRRVYRAPAAARDP